MERAQEQARGTRAETDGASPDTDQPDLDHDERRHAGSGPTPPEARVIHEVIREDGEKELERGSGALAWSALGAGLSMGFSFLTMAILRSGLPEAPWAKLVMGFGYTIGFLIVVLGRQQLFTESTLTAVLPLLIRKDAKTAYKLGRLWMVVLLGNLVGTFLFAFLISHTALFDPDVDKALRGIAVEALKDPFWPMAIKAILAGWLIALMVWLIPGAGPSRLLLIIILTYVVAIAHFSHIIAGSVEAAYDVFVGVIGFGEYFTRFLIPTLIGNTIGGVSLVAILNHVPLRDELPGREDEEAQ
jgi:formate/nitrite transporter FocA (FNT family)